MGKSGKISGRGSTFLLLYREAIGIGSGIEPGSVLDSKPGASIGTSKGMDRGRATVEGEETEEENTLESPNVSRNTARELIVIRVELHILTGL